MVELKTPKEERSKSRLFLDWRLKRKENEFSRFLLSSVRPEWNSIERTRQWDERGKKSMDGAK